MLRHGHQMGRGAQNGTIPEMLRGNLKSSPDLKQSPHPQPAIHFCAKQLLDFTQESFAKCGDGVMIRLHLASDEAKRYRLVGGPFYLARTEYIGRVAIEQQSQQDFWSIGWCTLIAVLLINQAKSSWAMMSTMNRAKWSGGRTSFKLTLRLSVSS